MRRLMLGSIAGLFAGEAVAMSLRRSDPTGTLERLEAEAQREALPPAMRRTVTARREKIGNNRARPKKFKGSKAAKKASRRRGR